MRRKLLPAVLAAVMSLGVGSVAVAQSGDSVTAQEETGDDNGDTGLWGLAGLLGLAGLAGLRRDDRRRDDHNRPMNR